MGTLTVKSSTIQSAADYENKDVNIAMSLNYNTSTGVISLISISGSVTDTTNGEPCCPRNRLRAEVLPVLAELWPGGSESAARCAASLAADEAYLWQLAEEFLAREGRTPLVCEMAALPRPLLVRVLQQLLPKPPEAVHIDAIAALLCEQRPGAALSLPGAEVCLLGGRFCVQPRACEEIAAYEIPLAYGVTPLPCGVAHFYKRGEELPLPEGEYPYVAELAFSAEAVRGALCLRPRKAGERVYSGGCHKLVRKLPAMTGLPRSVRAHAPLLCDGEGVLAVPFGPVRDGARGEAELVVKLFFY